MGVEDRTEIIIFDHKTGKRKRISVGKKTITLLKLLFVVMILTSAGGVFLGVNFFRESMENSRLLVENEHLKIKLARATRSASLLEREFVKVREFTLKVKKLLHWNVVGGDRLAKGDGEQNVDINVESPVARKVDEIFSDPSLYYDEIRSDLEAVIDGFKEKLSYLTSVPSIWPVKGWITSGFGYRISPFTHTLQFHEGVDIANAPGTPIIAPAEGYVLYTGWAHGYGNVIIIGHGYGISTVYGHLQKILVKQGQHVYRGEVIALLGSTGRSTGPHLHYEVRVNGVPVNPLNYIIEEK